MFTKLLLQLLCRLQSFWKLKVRKEIGIPRGRKGRKEGRKRKEKKILKSLRCLGLHGMLRYKDRVRASPYGAGPARIPQQVHIPLHKCVPLVNTTYKVK